MQDMSSEHMHIIIQL